MAERITINVDGREVETDAGELLIKAAQENGTYIPRFCWHPRMNPVGMCRMCLVEIETPRGTMMTTSCTTNCSDGMVVNTESDTVKKAQEGVLEFLLINHPLDCPVCDRGGECPLQDQTMAYGPGESRFVEEKRHYEKPIPISDLVLLDRERCILCARCTRFSDEISGDPLIEFKDRGYGTQVQTFPDEPFASYFSGNTVQICPVGALTAVPYRFRARPWDLRMVESSSLADSVHARLSIHASQNEVLRFNGVDNDATNHGWLSDKDRFGFEFINSPDRLAEPLVKGDDGEFHPAGWAEALDLVASRLGAIVAEHGGAAVGGIGGARGTNEDAYAFGKFMRVAVGTNHLDAQLADGLDPQFAVGVQPRARIADLEAAKTILVWGPDLKEEFGTLYLRVRRAAQELGATLIVVHPRATGLDDRAAHKLTYRPGDGPEVLRLLADGEGEYAAARQALGEGPVVALVGLPGLAEDARLAEAVAAFARDALGAAILPLARRANVFGALDMGVAPTLLPGRSAADGDGFANLEAHWGPLPEEPGHDTVGMLNAGAAGEIKGFVLCGADPVRDVPRAGLAEAALEAAEFVVAVDLFINDSNSMADVLLPALGFAEKEGTVTNLEGRVQKLNKLVPGAGQSRADWAILVDLADRLGKPLGFDSPEKIMSEIAEVAPAYGGISWDLVEFTEPDGAVVPLEGAVQPLQYVPVDASPPVQQAPFVLHLARTLYDDGVLIRMGPSLGKLAPGTMCSLHPDDAFRLGVADGDEVTVTGSDWSIVVPVKVDSSLARGAAYLPFNQPGIETIGADIAVEIAAAR